MKIRLLLLICFISQSIFAQDKIPLNIDDLAQWNSIKQEKISADGQWVSYTLQPNHGDPTVVLYNANTDNEVRFERANQPHFTRDNALLVFRIHPAMDSVRLLKLAETKKDDLPPDTLGIYNIATGTLEKVADLKNFKVPEKWGGWIAYGIKSPLPDSITKGIDKSAYQLVIRSTTGLEHHSKEAVRSYTFSEEYPSILLASDGLDSLDSAVPGIFYFDGKSEKMLQLTEQAGTYDKLTLSTAGQHAAWLVDADTTEVEIRPYELQYWNTQFQQVEQICAPTADWMDEDWRLSEHGNLYFSHDETKLYFGIAPNPVLPDTNTLEEERAKVEVWTSQDPLLYTVDKHNVGKEKKRTYTCVYHLKAKSIVQLNDPSRKESSMADRGDAPFLLSYDQTPYQLQTMWEGPLSAKDLYLTNVNDGSTRQVATAEKGYLQWSPEGNYVYWFSFPDTAWVAVSTDGGAPVTIADNSISQFADEENDAPDYPWFYGSAGWSENDKFFYVYDRYDIWKLDPTGKSAPVRITDGREQKRVYRYVRLDKEERHLPNNSFLLHFHDEETCSEGYASLQLATSTIFVHLGQRIKLSKRVTKSSENGSFLFTNQSFEQFPDLRYVAYDKNGDFLSKQISHANPQQENYNWGTIEHYTWTSTDGQELRGLLVKPDGFDPSKQYPMIVNFYEKDSHRLHDHRMPTAHRSTINYHYYTSRGYVIFNPDVPYRIGYPGESAYNAVVSGVTSLIDKGFIDRDHIGVQGHSWGGYQIAHLLTKTDIFACAESGAPVVNMYSAYGGIRWGSGLSRQFQYEHTQSRIGGSIWEYPVRYWENSPLFTMDKVNTPVLIMHNDGDGHVPWYQGIEYFNALRRLQKPAWFLNYNGEPHWPLKRPNRVDFQRRMSQFFDHFLKDEPMPEWMSSGVPPILKGIDQRY